MRGEKGKPLQDIKLKKTASSGGDSKGLASILNDQYFAAPLMAGSKSPKSSASNPHTNNGSEYVLVDAGDAVDAETSETLKGKLKDRETELKKVKDDCRQEVVKLRRQNAQLEHEISDLKSQVNRQVGSPPRKDAPSSGGSSANVNEEGSPPVMGDQLRRLEDLVEKLTKRAEVLQSELAEAEESSREVAEKEKGALVARITELESTLLALEKRALDAEVCTQIAEAKSASPKAFKKPALDAEVGTEMAEAKPSSAKAEHTEWQKAEVAEDAATAGRSMAAVVDTLDLIGRAELRYAAEKKWLAAEERGRLFGGVLSASKDETAVQRELVVALDEVAAQRERIFALEEEAEASAQNLAKAEGQASSALLKAALSSSALEAALKRHRSDEEPQAKEEKVPVVGVVAHLQKRNAAVMYEADTALLWQRKLMAAEERARLLTAEVMKVKVEEAARKSELTEQLVKASHEKEGLKAHVEELRAELAQQVILVETGAKEVLRSGRENERLMLQVEELRASFAEKMASMETRGMSMYTMKQNDVLLSQAEAVLRWKRKAVSAEERLQLLKHDFAKLKASNEQMRQGQEEHALRLEELQYAKKPLQDEQRERIFALEEEAKALAQKVVKAEGLLSSALLKAALSSSAMEAALTYRRGHVKARAFEIKAPDMHAHTQERNAALMLQADAALLWKKKVFAAEERARLLTTEVAKVQVEDAARKSELTERLEKVSHEKKGLEAQVQELREKLAQQSVLVEMRDKELPRSSHEREWLTTQVEESRSQVEEISSKEVCTTLRSKNEVLLSQAEAVLKWQRKASSAEERLRLVESDMARLKESSIQAQAEIAGRMSETAERLVENSHEKERLAVQVAHLNALLAEKEKPAQLLQNATRSSQRNEEEASNDMRNNATVLREAELVFALKNKALLTQERLRLQEAAMPALHQSNGQVCQKTEASIASAPRTEERTGRGVKLAKLQEKARLADEILDRVFHTAVEAKARAQDATTRLDRVQKDWRQAKDQSLAFEQRAAEAERKLLELRSQQARSTAVEVQLAEHAAGAEKAAALAKQLVGSVHEEKQRLADEVEGLRALLSEQATLLQARDEELEDTGRALRRTEQEFRNIEEELRTEQAETHVLRARTKLIIPLESTIMKKDEDLRNLEGLLLKRVEELQVIEKRLQEKDQEMQKSRAVAAEAVKRADAMSAHISAANAELSRTQAGSSMLSEHHRAEVQSLKNQFEETARKTEELQQQLEEANKREANQAEEKERLKSVLDETKQDLEKSRKDLDKSKRQLDYAKKQLEEIQNREVETNKVVQEQSRELPELSKKLEDKQQDAAPSKKRSSKKRGASKNIEQPEAEVNTTTEDQEASLDHISPTAIADPDEQQEAVAGGSAAAEIEDEEQQEAAGPSSSNNNQPVARSVSKRRATRNKSRKQRASKGAFAETVELDMALAPRTQANFLYPWGYASLATVLLVLMLAAIFTWVV